MKQPFENEAERMVIRFWHSLKHNLKILLEYESTGVSLDTTVRELQELIKQKEREEKR